MADIVKSQYWGRDTSELRDLILEAFQPDEDRIRSLVRQRLAVLNARLRPVDEEERDALHHLIAKAWSDPHVFCGLNQTPMEPALFAELLPYLMTCHCPGYPELGLGAISCGLYLKAGHVTPASYWIEKGSQEQKAAIAEYVLWDSRNTVDQALFRDVWAAYLPACDATPW